MSGPSQRPSSGSSRQQARAVLCKALDVVFVVLRNSLLSLLCAWVANFCYSLGNIFSLRRSELQSTESLIVANMVWTNVLFCVLLLLTHSAMLLPNRFLSHPNKKPSIVFCMKKLVKRTYPYYIASIVLMTTWAEITASVLPVHLRWLKLNFYVGAILMHVYSTGLDMATRAVYSEDTCEGEARRARFAAIATTTAVATPASNGTRPRADIQDRSPPQGRISLPPGTHRRRRRYWRIFFQTFPKVLTVTFAGAYVQIASQSAIFSHGPAIAAFAGVSFTVKLAIQELAKVYAMRRNIEQIRFLCILVGVPTVLIDTQVRIVLLGVQSTQFAIAGSLVMAISEIVMRTGKMALLRFEIKHQQRAFERRTQSTSAVSSRSLVHAHPASTLSRALSFSSQSVSSLASFERWKQQRTNFHTAEVIADMYAEYIAIGCSASILYFFSGHPKYQYGEHSTASSSTTQLQSIALQIGLEVFVDSMSCAFEIASGAKFDGVRKLSSYLVFMFMTIAVVNIGISSFLYLK